MAPFLYDLETLKGLRIGKELAPTLPQCGSIYFLWQDDDLKYVGQTRELNMRIVAHMRTGQKRFTHISYITVPPAFDWMTAYVEACYIHALRPDWNIKIPPGPERAPLAHLRYLNDAT